MTISKQVLISVIFYNFQKPSLAEHRSEFRVNRSHGLLVPGFWSSGGPCCGPNFCPNFFCAFGKPIWETSFADHENRRTPNRKTRFADHENNTRRSGKQDPTIRKTRSADLENNARRSRKQKNAEHGLAVFRVRRCSTLALVDVRFWHLAVFVSVNLTRVQIRRLYSNCIENSIARGVRFCYLVVFVFVISKCSFFV